MAITTTNTKIQLSSDQQQVLKALLKWYANKTRPQFITVGGYAGTGKTTLIAVFRKLLEQKLRQEKRQTEIENGKKAKSQPDPGAAPIISIAFATYTGKASRVLKNKLEDLGAIYKNDTVGTIHSLIYSPIENDAGIITGWEKKDKIDATLIIVDEASMVDEQIWKDLLSYNKPIIAVGDHGQLPPVTGKFSLMTKPHLKLEEIHRQAKDNPIIKLSVQARLTGKLLNGEHGPTIRKLRRSDPDAGQIIEDLLNSYNHETLILCGYNNTRVKLNHYLRNIVGMDSLLPQSGDRVICLRNNREEQIFNGMLGTIQSIEHKTDKPGYYRAEIEMDDTSDLFSGYIVSKQFNNPESLNFTDQRARYLEGDLFDYGYALTVHKAQGSEAKRVILFEERFKQMDDSDWKRWLYTGITRAAEELYVVG